MWSMTISDTFGGNETWDNMCEDVFDANSLEHWGIKGMKWGVRRTPEQLGHILAKKNAKYYGKYNKAVRKISAVQGNKTVAELSPKEKAKIAKAIEKTEQYLKKIGYNEEKYGEKIKKAETRQAKTEEKAAEKQAKEDAKNQKLKEKIIKDADWDAVMENRQLFSDSEINTIANRVSAEKRLKEALESGKGLDKLADNLKKVTNVAGAGLDLYDKYSKIKGIFDEGKRETAYKEIRQLMAEGKTAEVIKRSVDISDKDLSNFSSRHQLLQKLNKQLGTTSADKNDATSNEKKESKTDKKAEKAAEKELKAAKNAEEKKKKELQNEIRKAEKTEEKKQKAYKKGLGANLDQVIDLNNIGSYNTKTNSSKELVMFPSVNDSAKATTSLDAKTLNIVNANMANAWDTRRINAIKNAPLVLADIGDFTLAELKSDTSKADAYRQYRYSS